MNYSRLIALLVVTLFVGTSNLSSQTRPGSLDPSFGSGAFVTTSFAGNTQAYDVAIQPDGKIVVVGIQNPGGIGFLIARYNVDGSLDTSFDSDGKVITPVGNISSGAKAVAIQTNGKIVVAGNTIVAGNPSHLDFAVVRYNVDGSLDTTFDADGIATTDFISFSDDSALDMAIQSDGRIVVGGYSLVNGTVFSGSVARYNPNGSLDTTLDGDGKLSITGSSPNCIIPTAIALQSNDKLVVTGGNSCTAPGTDFTVFRFNANGTFDTAFDGDGKVFTNINLDDNARGVAIQSDGKIVVTGITQLNPNDFDIAIVRYNTNGSLDTSFDGDGIKVTPITNFLDDGSAVAIQKDGKIAVAGLTRPDAVNDTAALVRYDSDGSADRSFGSNGIVITTIGLQSSYRSIAAQSDGKIITVGERWNGTSTDFLVARYLGNGTQFDFDGDRKADLSIFRPGPGEWWWLRSSNGSNAAVQFGAATDRIAPVDFTGDGKTDVAFWRPSTGQWFVLRSEDFSFYAFPFGANGDVPVPADYDADGKADAAVFRESSVTWFISKSSGGTDIVGFGAVGDKPVNADYDGDGKSDIAIFRPSGASGAEWWIRRSSNASVVALQFGASTDKAVAGDYTGDGKADVAFWRPLTGFWNVLRSEDFSYYAFPFGTTGDVASPGDYDGDGKLDAAVFRPSNATWFANRSTAGVLIQQFGTTGDLPLPNAFVR